MNKNIIMDLYRTSTPDPGIIRRVVTRLNTYSDKISVLKTEISLLRTEIRAQSYRLSIPSPPKIAAPAPRFPQKLARFAATDPVSRPRRWIKSAISTIILAEKTLLHYRKARDRYLRDFDTLYRESPRRRTRNRASILPEIPPSLRRYRETLSLADPDS